MTSRMTSVLAVLTMFAAAQRLGAQITVIDMIPLAMSDERRRDSEPFLAVNPANPQVLAASAFMDTPMGSPNGPLLISTDGGNTWIARNIIPSHPLSTDILNTFDITIRFDSSGNALYAGILANPTLHQEILRTTDMTLTTAMDVLASRPSPDQPYVAAQTVTGWFDAGKDRLWVGNNDGSAHPNSATIDQALDALTGAAPTVTQIRIDRGTPSGQDHYEIRPAVHADGHVYAAFYRRRGDIAGGYNVDVVVVREDNWGNTATPFQSLGAGGAGTNVVTSVPIAEDLSGSFGNEIISGDLFLTIDPNDSRRLYLSWAQKDGTDLMTLHLRHSIDSGETWSADLLTVPSAKNAAVAVNSQGRIAYLYQQLTGTPGSRHWQTHLRRSNDGTTAWDDVTLSDFLVEGDTYRIIGDYLAMAAVGKSFYGVFSAHNDLVTASFPAGVTFQRNRTAPGVMPPRFLGVDGVTTVASSIDPFFFRTTEIAPAADLYVRDWTDGAASRDHGQEPSTHADFFSTSDVWNRRTNAPASFSLNDQPQVQDPQPAAMGHNFAFARVSRESAGTALDVSVQFLYSDGGVGVPYVSAGPPATLHLNAADLSRTLAAGSGYQWDLPSGASNHVCLAVEVSTPSDPIIPPSLVGHAPGWPATDLMVVADNDKAQRNMQVFGFGGMSGGMSGGVEASAYAIVGNAAERTRDVAIGLFVDPKRLRELGGATVRVLGSSGSDPQRVQPGSILTLSRMEPGETRWIEIRFTPTERLARPLPVTISELVGGQTVNGYAFVLTPMPLESAIRDTLFQHAAVFTRLAKGFGIENAEEQVLQAQRLLRPKRIDPKLYSKFLAASTQALQELTARLFGTGGQLGDPFGTAEAVKSLAGAPGNPAAAQVLHLTLLNKLDATATFYQRAGGAP
jgi:hypothetical protein